MPPVMPGGGWVAEALRALVGAFASYKAFACAVEEPGRGSCCWAMLWPSTRLLLQTLHFVLLFLIPSHLFGDPKQAWFDITPAQHLLDHKGFLKENL